MSITKQNLHTFLAPELFLVRTLHAKLANIVTWLIIVILFYICRRYLCHITKYMGSVRINVLTDASALDIKAGKTVHLFLKDAELFL